MLWNCGAGFGKVRLYLLEGVAGSALFGLEDKLNAGERDGCTYTVSLMADDAINVLGWHYRLRGVDYMQQQGLAADLMQDLGPLTFEPRTLTRGHDGNGKSGCVHR